MGKIISWWQHIPEHINPNLFVIGQFQLRYYGLMYIAAFAAVYLFSVHRIEKENQGYTKETVQNYFLWAVPGLLIGARLGYVFLYDFGYFAARPLEIILPLDLSRGIRYTGIYGMSYHGGFLGLLISTVLFCARNKLDFWGLADLFAVAAPLGFTFGRIGNFINGELYGRITSVPWGMYFPLAGDGALRHPSQLYAAFLEGILIFLILRAAEKRKLRRGFLLSLYIILYGAARFAGEFAREPDPQLGFVWGIFTMGQVLSLVMAACGVFIMLRPREKENT